MTEQITHNNRKSFRSYFSIFLVVLFPQHVWGLLMIFNDFQFVSERTVVWDAVGYASYTLLYLLVECLVITLVLWGISLLLPKAWSQTRVVSVVGSVYTILFTASIVDFSAHFFDEARLSRQYLYGLENFTALTYALIAAAILLASAACLWLILRTEKGEKVFAEIFGRISLLSYLYLFLDFAGIVIIILRNVSEAL